MFNNNDSYLRKSTATKDGFAHDFYFDSKKYIKTLKTNEKGFDRYGKFIDNYRIIENYFSVELLDNSEHEQFINKLKNQNIKSSLELSYFIEKNEYTNIANIISVVLYGEQLQNNKEIFTESKIHHLPTRSAINTLFINLIKPSKIGFLYEKDS